MRIRQALSILGRRPLHLGPAAAGENSHCNGFVLRTETFHRFCLRIFPPYLIQKRMSDKGNLHTGFPIVLLFEREDDGHPIYRLSDRIDSSLSPGPHLGADIVDDF